LEQENQDLENKLSEKEEESSCLKNLNQRLLKQIKGLQEKEASKSSDVKIQVMAKGTNTDLANIKTQENSNPVEEKTYTDVGVQTMDITITIKGSHGTKTPYQHRNNERRHFNESKYPHHS